MNGNWIYGKPILGRRAGAFLIDFMIVTLIALFPFFFYEGFSGEAAVFALFPVTMAIGICGLVLKDVFGRSLGKKLFGIYIAHEQEPSLPVSVGQRILRNIPLLIWPVEAVIMLKEVKGRRLGDRLAGTRAVINVEKKRIPVLVIAISAFAVFFLIVFFSVSLMIKNDGSYKTAVEYIESQSDIVSAVGGIEGFGLFPSGSLGYSNGSGSADLKITVIGENASVTVEIRLEKPQGGQWCVKDFSY